MLSIARLLDGLEVAFDPPPVADVRRGWSGTDCAVNAVSIHCTLSGGGVFEFTGGACLRFSRHSVTVVPPQRYARVDGGVADPDGLVVRGRIRATYHGSVDLFERLQEPLVEPLAADDPIGATFEALLDEITGQRPGARAMAEALLKRCLILLLRRQCGHGAVRPRWLAPLEDARLGRVVAAMQARPEQAFTLSALAEVAGMSRSVFAAHFSDAMGQPPIEFLKALRLARAAQLLTGTDLPVKGVAMRVGYASRSSFTRAFIARHGVCPMAFRAAARAPAAAAVPVTA